MAIAAKRAWQRPAVRPLTSAESRADVPDAPVQNTITSANLN